MPIPLIGAQAHGGKLISLDDPAVPDRDGAALDGSGGVSYAPHLLSSPLGLTGWNKLRRLVQYLHHTTGVTVKARAYRDGLDSGQEITRVFGIGAVGVATCPFDAAASDVQVRVELSGFTEEVQLDRAELWVVQKRRVR